MGVARAIVSILVALSVALLPVAGGAVAGSTQAVAAMASEMSADADTAMDDCCPNHAKPCDSGSDQCRSMATCAHQFLTIADVPFSQLKYSATRSRLVNLLADSDVSSQLGSPPFRPPRI
jgi:hypothetical protein